MPIYFIQAILLIGLTGIYYKSTGAALAWLLVALTAWMYRKEALSSNILKFAACLIGALVVGSLFSVNPILSIGGCLKISLGMLFFFPGLFLGRLLRDGSLNWWQIAPFTLLYLAHYLSPHIYDGNLIFGFSRNPNTIGQGVTYALFLFGIVCCADNANTAKSTEGQPKQKQRGKQILYWVTGLTLSSLLIIANCRQGWLAITTGAAVFILTSKRISTALKALAPLAGIGLLGVLLALRDYKGFGYGSVGERLDLWSRSLHAWAQHFPVFGAGFSSFEAMSKYYYYGNVTKVYWHPHNIAIEILFSGGLWAAAATTVFAWVIARDLRGHPLTLESERINRAVLGSLVGMLLMGQLDMGITSIRLIGSFATLVGILYAQSNPDSITLTKQTPQPHLASMGALKSDGQ